MPNYRLGCIPSVPDQRDFKLSLPVPASFAPIVDLRPKMVPVYDQGNLGSCTGNAVAGALEWENIKEGQKPFLPSRLFAYYNGRDAEGRAAVDAGAAIRDVVKAANALGVCNEKTWPYNVQRFAVKPPAKAYAEGKTKFHRALQYQTVDGLQQFKTALSHHNPVVLGFVVYRSFFDIGKSGMMPIPQPNEHVMGGHAVLVVGYHEPKQILICRNSWGENWGHNGHFYMPYALLNTDQVFDCWTINKV